MKKKPILITLGAVVVVALVVFQMTRNDKSGTEVKAAEVTARKITEIVSASGRIQPKTKVDITSQINGEIIALLVREGDRVSQGQLLAVLDTVQLRSDLDRALYSLNEVRARASGAEATYSQSKEEFDRQQRLYDSKLTSETAFTDARYAYLNSAASLEAAKAQSDQFQAAYEKQLDNLSKAKIVSPMAGVITYLDVEVGEIAAAQTAFTQGKTLMTVANLDVFEVEVEVDETEIAKVELDQTARIEVDAFPDTAYAGQVVEIGNTALTSGSGTQNVSTNFKVKIVFNQPNKLIRPGMSATVDITTAERADVATVPFSSIVMRTLDLDSLEMARANEDMDTEEGVNTVHAAENELDTPADNADNPANPDGEDDKHKEYKGVFVIREGKARFVPVETGIADHQNIQVLSGLETGDTVISGPYGVLRSVNDGDDVKPEDTKKMGKP
jgi:HlyD family secretion protein